MKFRRLNITWLLYCQVYCDDVTEPLLVVEDGGEVGDEDDQSGGDVYGHDGTENVSLEAELDTNPDLAVLKCLIGDLGGDKAVLVYLCRSDPLDQFRVGQLEEILIFR